MCKLGRREISDELKGGKERRKTSNPIKKQIIDQTNKRTIKQLIKQINEEIYKRVKGEINNGTKEKEKNKSFMT